MTASGWLRAAIVAVFLACGLWGLEQDLPYTPEVDEPDYVVRAGRMASNIRVYRLPAVTARSP